MKDFTKYINKRYDTHKIRHGEQELKTKIEKELIDILFEFADTIDPYGSDDGDYDTAMAKLQNILHRMIR